MNMLPAGTPYSASLTMQSDESLKAGPTEIAPERQEDCALGSAGCTKSGTVSNAALVQVVPAGCVALCGHGARCETVRNTSGPRVLSSTALLTTLVYCTVTKTTQLRLLALQRDRGVILTTQIKAG